MFFIGPDAIKKPRYLYPGELFVTGEPQLVTTILGSCVSVCLWDVTRRIAGINHYLLPLWNGLGLPTPRFGDIAVSMLIERMMAQGSLRKNMVAKIFGGATMWEHGSGVYAVGERNVDLAFRTMAQEGVSVVAADVEGEAGRKIILDTETGEVTVQMNRMRSVQGKGFATSR